MNKTKRKQFTAMSLQYADEIPWWGTGAYGRVQPGLEAVHRARLAGGNWGRKSSGAAYTWLNYGKLTVTDVMARFCLTEHVQLSPPEQPFTVSGAAVVTEEMKDGVIFRTTTKASTAVGECNEAYQWQALGSVLQAIESYASTIDAMSILTIGMATMALTDYRVAVYWDGAFQLADGVFISPCLPGDPNFGLWVSDMDIAPDLTFPQTDAELGIDSAETLLAYLTSVK